MFLLIFEFDDDVGLRISHELKIHLCLYAVIIKCKDTKRFTRATCWFCCWGNGFKQRELLFKAADWIRG